MNLLNSPDLHSCSAVLRRNDAYVRGEIVNLLIMNNANMFETVLIINTVMQ